MIPSQYLELRAAVIAAGFEDEIDWSEHIKEPDNADDFAAQAIWVILCSGMKAQVARVIEERVWKAIEAKKTVQGNVLGKSGKAVAIDSIWRDRDWLFARFQEAENKVEFCHSLPWIGNVTKWHLAKNLGIDCSKPDIHLSRIAKHYGTTPEALCAGLSSATGDRIATVDLVIWRACNLGIVNSRKLTN